MTAPHLERFRLPPKSLAVIDDRLARLEDRDREFLRTDTAIELGRRMNLDEAIYWLGAYDGVNAALAQDRLFAAIEAGEITMEGVFF
jgi:hypothetical protein